MTTVASIINSAFRETNLTPLGVAPTTAQSDEAFILLSTIVSGVLGNEAGENIVPMPLGQNDIDAPSGYPWYANELPADIFVPTNIRLMCNLTGDGLVNLHPTPHDGARMGVVDVSQNFDLYPLTINGNGRMIEGASELELSDAGEAREWVYRGDLGNWVVVTPLAADGEMPWPPEFDDMFIIMLAYRLNPRYGQTIHPASAQALQSAMSKFSARYKQSNTQMPSEDGLLFLTNQTRYYGYGSYPGYGTANAAFNSGVVF